MSVPILKRARQRPQATSGKAILCEGIRPCMKTMLNIDDTVMAELKREAARQGRTMSELVETALRLLLTSRRKRPQRRSTRRCCRPRCPVPRHGGSLVLAVTPMCWPTPPMRTRNFIPPAATGWSANGRDRMLGTLLGARDNTRAGHATAMERAQTSSAPLRRLRLT
jgi:Ribbon-helix-helix protein, copG family